MQANLGPFMSSCLDCSQIVFVSLFGNAISIQSAQFNALSCHHVISSPDEMTIVPMQVQILLKKNILYSMKYSMYPVLDQHDLAKLRISKKIQFSNHSSLISVSVSAALIPWSVCFTHCHALSPLVLLYQDSHVDQSFYSKYQHDV